MKKIIIACLLATSAASAFAEWTRVGENDEGIYYIDYETIRKDGSLRKVWLVQDLKQRDENGEMSRRLRMEYDCNGERWRAASYSGHSQSMASGDTVKSASSTTSWSDIPPQSGNETILKIVCTK